MRFARRIALFVTAVMLLMSTQAAFAPAQNPQEARSVNSAGAVGSQVPDFCLNDLNGRRVCSSQFHGKVLLIDFWASWCAPCKKEMPAYEKFREKYGPRGLSVIGIGLSMDTPANLKRFAAKLGVHYTLLMGTMQVQNKFGLKGIPTTILADRTGVIRKVVVGFDYSDKFDAPIQRALK